MESHVSTLFAKYFGEKISGGAVERAVEI